MRNKFYLILQLFPYTRTTSWYERICHLCDTERVEDGRWFHLECPCMNMLECPCMNMLVVREHISCMNLLTKKKNSKCRNVSIIVTLQSTKHSNIVMWRTYRDIEISWTFTNVIIWRTKNFYNNLKNINGHRNVTNIGISWQCNKYIFTLQCGAHVMTSHYDRHF